MPSGRPGPVAALVVGAIVASYTTPAHAADQTRSDVAVIAGSLGLGLSITGVIYGTSVAIDLMQIRNGQRSPFDGPYALRAAQFGTFTIGGVLLALGGVAVGLQASAGGPCPGPSACQVAYGFGATSLAAGVGMIVEGIVISTAPRTVRVRLPFLSRGSLPVLVPLVQGSTLGVGAVGTF